MVLPIDFSLNPKSKIKYIYKNEKKSMTGSSIQSFELACHRIVGWNWKYLGYKLKTRLFLGSIIKIKSLEI